MLESLMTQIHGKVPSVLVEPAFLDVGTEAEQHRSLLKRFQRDLHLTGKLQPLWRIPTLFPTAQYKTDPGRGGRFHMLIRKHQKEHIR
jgi:hypothetical protein